MRLRRVMNKAVLRVPANRPLRAVLEALRERKVHGAVICEDAIPVGTFTARDALRVLASDPGPPALDAPVIEAVGMPLRTLPATASLDDALQVFLEEDLDLVPVTGENETLLGTLTLHDLVSASARSRRAWGL